MRRALGRLAGLAGGACFRVSRALHTQPEQARTEAWVRDRGDRTLRLDYDLDATSLVFDLGGYEGQWASDIFGRYACAIHVFEPVPEFADRISERFRANPRIVVHRFGLSPASGTATITLDGDATSLYGTTGKRRTIELVEAAAFFRERGVDAVDLVKINIEGAEYDLLDHLIDTRLVQRLGNIQVQFHDIVPDAQARLAALEARLARTHDLSWRYPFVWESWRLKADPAAR